MGVASAASPWTSVHETYTEVTHNTCDVTGLTVRLNETSDTRARYVLRGPDRLPYYMEHTRTSDVYTNTATGKSVTEVELRNENTLSATDNGDGTWTNVHQAIGNNKMYDEAGNVIAHRGGRILVELTFDQAGTPQDPTDDQFLSVRVVGESSHGDNFCTSLVQAIG
jgi:hypothetical protein